MARGTGSTGNGKSRDVGVSAKARIRKSAKRPINTSGVLLEHLGFLMQDLSSSDVTPDTGNCLCNVAGKMLATVKMTYDFGTPRKSGAVPRPTQFLLTNGTRA